MSFLNQSIILTKSFLLKFTQPISYSLYDIGNMIWVFKIKIQFEWNEAYVKALNSWHKIRNLAWSSFLKICQVAQEKVWSFLQVIGAWWYFWRLYKGFNNMDVTDRFVAHGSCWWLLTGWPTIMVEASQQCDIANVSSLSPRWTIATINYNDVTISNPQLST